MSPEEELRQTVAHIQVVSQQYLAGNPTPFQGCWSRADDVTIFGAWGAYERVTQLYRREAGAWKIIHRHGDAVIEKIAATAVLQ